MLVDSEIGYSTAYHVDMKHKVGHGLDGTDQ
jgi:hypothetical protein